MGIRIASSTKGTVEEAVHEIRGQLEGLDATMVAYFASSVHPPGSISMAMEDAFAGATVFGCSTAGEIVSGRMLTGSVVAMAFDKGTIRDVKVEVLQDLEHDSFETFKAFERHFGEKMSRMNPEKYVGIMLIDGLSRKEELLIDRMGDLTNVHFIGGSAGDDLKFAATSVYANGGSYRNAAVLALIEPAVPFACIKTQSFRSLGKTLMVTRANEATREVLEFNGRPAAAAYADALGVPVSEAPKRFMHNPVGLVIDGEPYVRSPQQINGTAMVFYCSVTKGMELTLLESTDIIADTAQALGRARNDLGGLSGLINFNCILRTMELDSRHQCATYGSLFAEVPTIGFSTYGEQFIGHINQTATMLAFR